MNSVEPPEKRPATRLETSAVGLEFALGILLLGGLGWLGDGAIGWRDTFPVLTVLGVFVGFGWGVWRLVRRLGRRKPPPGP